MSRMARFSAAAASSITIVLAFAGPPAWGQATPTVKVDPTSGAPGATFTITMSNYKACPNPTTPCIIIDFIQGATTTRIGTADSKGQASFAGQVKVPPTALPGPADVRAHVEGGEDAKAGFTVLAPSTTTAPTSTTTSSTTTTTTPTTLLPPTSSST